MEGASSFLARQKASFNALSFSKRRLFIANQRPSSELSCKRGQLSLEALLLTAIGICLLAISLASLSSLSGRAASSFSQSEAQSALSKISFYSDDVCIMGEGNVRIVDTELALYRLTYESKNLSLTYKNSRASKKAKCEIIVPSEPIAKTARISYENGKVKIEQAN